MRCLFVWAIMICVLTCISGPAQSAMGRNKSESPVANISLLYHPDCMPCRYEASILPDVAKQFPDIQFNLIVMYDEGKKAELPKMKRTSNINVTAANSPKEKVMEKFGNILQALPYSMGFNSKGKACAQHYGVLEASVITKWQEQCKQSLD